MAPEMASEHVFILLFRGVGGKTQLPTAPLRAALLADGFRKAATYINSGNALVLTDRSASEVLSRTAEICRKAFGFDKDIYALPLADWQARMAANPFPEATEPGRFLHMAVLARAPEPDRLDALRAVAGPTERIAVTGETAWLHTPDGFGTSKLAAKFDKGIGVANTARNWNSVVKLAQMAEAMAGS